MSMCTRSPINPPFAHPHIVRTTKIGTLVYLRITFEWHTNKYNSCLFPSVPFESVLLKVMLPHQAQPRQKFGGLLMNIPVGA